MRISEPFSPERSRGRPETARGGEAMSGSGPGCWGGAARLGCAVSGRPGWCCTFDRGRSAGDRRNHAETPQCSTLLKSSHVQSGPSAHGSPSAENRRSRKTPESRGKPGIGSWGRSSPMCNTPARTEKNPTRPRGSPPGARPVQAPREVVPPPHSSRPPHRRSRRERLNAPTGAWCSLTTYSARGRA